MLHEDVQQAGGRNGGQSLYTLSYSLCPSHCQQSNYIDLLDLLMYTYFLYMYFIEG